MDATAWQRIKKLRQSYLDAQGFLPDYWADEALLAAYDETLAQRIRWKWRAVLEALPDDTSSWPRTLVDWGCGTGGASREVLAFKPDHFTQVVPLDRSAKAVDYAGKKLKELAPTVPISAKIPDGPFVLVISHVFSELPETELEKLLPLIARADTLLWVESGRKLESRRLSALREPLSATHTFLAPCPHQGLCGMLTASEAENWCHFKAPVPRDAHHSAFWRECSKQLGFDLRSLPVAYLYARRHESAGTRAADQIRVLAGSRSYKGYTRYNACSARGVTSQDFMKRHSKSIYEALAEPDLLSLYPAGELAPKGTRDE